MSFNYKKNKRGIIWTSVFHVVLIILLAIWGFTTPLPLPGEEGLLINFGSDDAALGLVEPKKNQVSKPVEKQVKKVPEKVEEKAQPEQKEEILTQDLEETVAVESSTKKKKEEKKKETKPKPKEETTEKPTKEEEKQEEIIEEKPREVNQNALFKGKSNNSTTGSEGDKTGQGNQGKETGSVDTKNRTGSGLGSGGNKWDLSGRSLVGQLPKPHDTSQKEGIVVVEIIVDRNGNVVSATAGVKGSTTLDQHLCSVAKKAALKAKFNKKPNAPIKQQGTITYHFVLE